MFADVAVKVMDKDMPRCGGRCCGGDKSGVGLGYLYGIFKLLSYFCIGLRIVGSVVIIKWYKVE